MRLQKSKSPDFSVIIPTCDRSELLAISLRSVLRQKNVAFEVIVCDDDSKDDTQRVVQTFEDTRIVYIKNKKRLGSSLNVQKCFRIAKGKYIFTLGDDDFILDDNTLSIIFSVMKKHDLGMAKIGTISYEESIDYPYKVYMLSNKLTVLKPKYHKNILVKTIDFGLGFYSGLVFDRSRIDNRKLIDHMCFVYFPIAFELIQKYGIAYIPDVFIVSRLSLRMIPTYFSIKKYGSFFMEDLLSLMKNYMNGNELVYYTRAYLRSQIPILPNIKYFTNYYNYFSVIRKIILLDQSLLFNLKFIIFACSGLLPNFVIIAIRHILNFFSKNHVARIVQKYNFYPNIEEIKKI